MASIIMSYEEVRRNHRNRILSQTPEDYFVFTSAFCLLNTLYIQMTALLKSRESYLDTVYYYTTTIRQFQTAWSLRNVIWLLYQSMWHTSKCCSLQGASCHCSLSFKRWLHIICLFTFVVQCEDLFHRSETMPQWKFLAPDPTEINN